jgi:hypothetical protein
MKAALFSKMMAILHQTIQSHIQESLVTAVWWSQISQVKLQDGNTFRSWIKLSDLQNCNNKNIFHKLTQLHTINTLHMSVILFGTNHNLYA